MVYKTFLVGGAVRDKLMGREAKDFDYVVVGANPQVLLAEGYEQVGMGFPVFLHPETREEYALARKEKKVGAGYTGFEFQVDEFVTLEDDLSRRDLTINSMAMSEDGTIIDPFGGQDDLASKVLRHTTEAFAEDPLRVVRLARFHARYASFVIAGETLKLCKVMVERGDLNELPDERFWLELEKAFKDGQAADFFHTLFVMGAFDHVKFFKRLLGDDNSLGRLMQILRLATHFNEAADQFEAGKVAHFFAAAVAPINVKGLFADVEATKVFMALQVVRCFDNKSTANDVHDLIMSVRGYSTENRTLENLVASMAAISKTDEQLALSHEDLMLCAKAGRQIFAQPFIDFGHQGKAIGEAMAAARIKLIDTLLNLQNV